METLLKPGDKITIREDIKEAYLYKMFIDDGNETKHNVWIPDMAKSNEQVTIKGMQHGQYLIEEDNFFSYTDEMFDPDLMQFLYEEYLLNN
jgi:hypothetical protein